MGPELRILVVEDDPNDAALFDRAVHNSALPYVCRRVDTREAYIRELKDFKPQVILSDYKLGAFDAMSALAIAREISPATPFIFVMDSMNQETLLACLNAGAADCVLKDDLELALTKVGMSRQNEQAQDAVRAAARQWRVTFDAISDAVCLLDEQGKVRRCNMTFRNLVGLPFQEIIGKACGDLLHPNQAAPDDCPVNEARRKHSRAAMVVNLGDRWFDHSADPILEDGTLTGFVNILSDITPTVKAQKELQAERERIQLYLDVVGVSVLALDRDGNVTLVNKKASELVGLEPNEILGKNWFQTFLPERLKDEAISSYQRMMAGEPALEYMEHYVRTKSGEERLIAWYNTLLRDNGGNIVGAIRAGEDVTERKQVEAALRRSESLNRSLVEHLPQRIFIKDRNSVYVSSNANYARDLGIEPGQIAGKDDFAFYPRELADMYRADDQAVMAGAAMKDVEEKYQVAGESRWVHTIKVPYHDEQGRIVGVLGIFEDITQRKRTENELTALQRQVEFILGATNTGLDIIDAQLNLRYVDAQWAKVYGDFRGRKCHEYLMDRADQCPRCAIPQALATKSKVVSEQVLVRESSRPIQVITFPFQDDIGEWLVAQINVDVTELKRMQADLRDSEQVLRTIFDRAMDGILVADLETKRFVHANKAICDMLGYTDNELRELTVGEIHPAEALPYVLSQFEAQARGESVLAQDIPMKRKDGSVFVADVNSAPAELRGRMCLIGVFRDITVRKQTQEALRESREKLRSIFENVGLGIALISPSMEVLELNRTMANWFPNANPDQRPLCYSVFGNPPRHGPCPYCPTIRTLHDGKVNEAVFETTSAHDDVKYRVVSSPIIGVDGNVVAAIEIMEDVTEQRKLEEQLQRVSKLESIGQLAGGVAHDFNNILTGIIGYSQLMLEKAERDSAIHHDLQEVLKLAERAANLTRQLLAFSRRQAMQPTVLNLNSLIEESIKMFRRLIGEKIELVFAPAPSLGQTTADPAQIAQVLMNLVVNARDAMPEGGKVTIETGNAVLDEDYAQRHVGVKPGPYVMVAVTDTGIGMDEATRTRLFEPFFTTKEVGKGTGLGLSTAYGIVKQHAGNIWVYSEPGKGTTFKIYLPTVNAEPSTTARPTTSPSPGGSETILVVEDEDSVRTIVKRVLEGQGYTVLTAACPGEAQATFAEHSDEVQLLLSDVVMPECTGTRLYEILSEMKPSLKILYMSGYSNKSMFPGSGLTADMPFLQKPLTPEAIAQKVREVLDS